MRPVPETVGQALLVDARVYPVEGDGTISWARPTRLSDEVTVMGAVGAHLIVGADSDGKSYAVAYAPWVRPLPH
jgi:hypothetical protein